MNNLFAILILALSSYAFSKHDSSNVYTAMPSKYITINKPFNLLLLDNVSKVNIDITTHRSFGDDGENITFKTSYYKSEEYRINETDPIFWSTLFMNNIDSIFEEDTSGFCDFGSFCSFDTLYTLKISNSFGKNINVYFSHVDLHQNRFRIIKNDRLYFLNINKRYAPLLRKYFKELFNKINTFNIPCDAKSLKIRSASMRSRKSEP